MQELGVNIIKVNPPHIKLQNQYVECCCAEEIRTKVINKLKAITGVTHVHVLTDSEGMIYIFLLRQCFSLKLFIVQSPKRMKIQTTV